MNEKEKQQRRMGIGGSDAAAILGLSPWKSPMDVWLEKMGIYKEERYDPEREFLLDLGHELEPIIAKLYERETKRALVIPTPTVFPDTKYKHLIGSPDRLVMGEFRGVELKSENQFSHEFGEPGTDQVPYHYLIQCAHYMAVTGYPVWDIALLHGGSRFEIYTIHRDSELEKEMTGQLKAWWDKHVAMEKPPDVDSSSAWRVYLNKKFPANLLPIADADQQTIRMIEQLERIRIYSKVLEKAEEEFKNGLKLKIGEHEGLKGKFGKVTWKKTKDWESVDWEAAFQVAAKGLSKERQAEIAKTFTFTRPGVRRFLFTPSKEWKGLNDGAGIEASARQIAGTGSVAKLGDGEHDAGSTSKSTN